MPLEIPGSSIRPPSKSDREKIVCPACKRILSTLKKVSNPATKQVKFVCPFCGSEIRG